MIRISVVYFDRVLNESVLNSFGKVIRSLLIVLMLAAGARAAFGAPSLSRVSCGTSTYQAAGTDPCSVYVAADTNKKLYIYLSSNNPAVTVPSAVTVRAGALSTGFNANVASVTTAQTATITARVGSVIKTFIIALSPAATGTPMMSLSTSSIPFGNVSAGTAISQSVTVTSSGTAALTINSDAISGTGFSLLGGNSFPMTLTAGQAIVISIQFNPMSAGAVTGQLTIASNAMTASVALNGTGTVAAPSVSALVCSSGSFTGSGSDNCTVSLSSTAPTGGQAISVSSNNSAVTAPATVTVAPGSSSASFTANVTWVNSAQTAALTANANSSSKTFALQLNAATAALAINATAIGFGNTYLNAPIEQAVTLSSSGTAPLTVSSVSISGTGFSESGCSFPVTLNPGQSVTIEVQFDPTTVGNFSGQLTIASNASTGTVALTGSGLAHKVALSWLAPVGSSDPVAGYNVYRIAAGTTSYQRLNTSTQSETSYIDTSVQSGYSYSYEVTSVDAQGVESAPSNAVDATIPQ